jgi:chaperonin cofactor prefoldin
MLYFPYMKGTDFEERFDRLETHLETVAKRIDVLARATEREFRDLHHSINHRFERVSARLETIEARIEVFSRRMDDEVDQRHKLAEPLSNLERSV